MAAASKIFFYVLPLVLLIVVLAILFGGTGLFTKVKEAILGTKEALPKVTVGLQEQKADVSIPSEYHSQIANLRLTISSMLGEGKENCFANFGGFSALGEEGPSLTFQLRGDKTFLTVFGGSGGKQVITDLSTEFPGMKPCVIAGKGNVAENFYTYFIEGKGPLIYPYYKDVNSLRIFGGGLNYNGIKISELELQSNLEDGGWLFTPDGEHICFFPTNFGVFGNTGESGIGNEWFTSDEDNSIPNKINQGKLQLCS